MYCKINAATRSIFDRILNNTEIKKYFKAEYCSSMTPKAITTSTTMSMDTLTSSLLLELSKECAWQPTARAVSGRDRPPTGEE
jgi:hypothetical protein